MSFDFKGKRILVTGAAQGIGRGISTALAEAGCHVFAMDKNRETLATLVSEFPSSVTAITADLSNWEETRDTLIQLEVMDGLVNNAGISSDIIPALDYPKDAIDKLMRVNLMGALNCIQVIGKKMVEHGKAGSIVNVSSVLGKNAHPDILGYTLPKAALDMVTKQFALELGPKQIRVNSVNPSLVRTEMMQRYIDDGMPLDVIWSKDTPMGRILTVKDVVGPVLYLLSDHASMVTGTTHMVDGGLLSGIPISK